MLADIQEHAGGQQHDEQTRAAIADERQRNSFGRHQAETTLRLTSAWPTTIVVMPSARNLPNSSGAFMAATKAAPAVNREKREHDDRADEAEFFADDRENKIGVRFGQKEKLLPAFHQADAGEAAGADGDERLQELEAAPCGSGSGMEEGFKARQAVRHANDEQINRGNGGEHRAADILQERPATKSMTNRMTKIMQAVPMSGSFRTSAASTSTVPSAGASVLQQIVDAKFSGQRGAIPETTRDK